MITVTPQGQVYLCKTPLENDYKHQLTFTSANAQLTYFNSTIQKTYDNYTYIKKDNVIKVGENIDAILDCNYLFYKNTGFTNKYYFCFITNMEYINENCTAITIETDVFQTYQFDIVYKKSFIEREHVNDDTIGANTVPEQLETGDYIIQDVSHYNYNNGFHICVAVSDDIVGTGYTYQSYNGVVSGLTYIAIESDTYLKALITRYTVTGKIDAILSMFMIPDGYLPAGSWITDATGTINYKYISHQETPFDLGNITETKPTRLGEGDIGYAPKNNKLFTYPYCYLYADNNAGSGGIYNWEYFTPLGGGSSATAIKFNAIGVINSGCSIKFLPVNYKNITGDNYSEAVNGAKLPVGSWTNDLYISWLVQNIANIGVNVAGNVLQIVGGAMMSGSGGVAGAGNITSGILGIANTVGEVYKHSLTPDQAEGNLNSSDVMFSAGKIGLSLYKMSIKLEFAEIIDKFFTMYGYKVNKLKAPNITGRAYYNYVKTINCDFEGDIPQMYLNKIKDVFNNGVTLWHNTAHFLDYDVNNTIVQTS